MNPSTTRIWNIPPPPGTEEEELSNCSSKRDGSVHSGSRAIDRIDPYIKAPEYLEFVEKKCSSEQSKYRSRSRSRSRGRHHKRRHSRSKSRERYRPRSRSRRRHRRRHSSSRSSSRSPGYRHSRRRHGRRRRSSSRYSRSRSKSTSRTRRSRGSRGLKRERKSATPRKTAEEQPVLDADINEVDMKIEEEEEEDDLDPVKDNVFKNDGSFLEMFKKMQEQQQQLKAQQESEASEEAKKPPMPVFGKRRGGKVLKTGMVQKVRLTNEEESNAQDAWSVYMKEVRRYKEACCDDDSKTRPLVK